MFFVFLQIIRNFFRLMFRFHKKTEAVFSIISKIQLPFVNFLLCSFHFKVKFLGQPAEYMSRKSALLHQKKSLPHGSSYGNIFYCNASPQGEFWQLYNFNAL